LNGLTPILVDTDDDLCMSPEALVSNITAKTKAVIFIAMGGGVGQLTSIQEICKRNNLALIIDAAHSAGSRENGQHIGTKADAICYSFQAVKNLPTGDSGLLSMLLDAEHALAKKLSWLGISESTFARAKSGSYKWNYEVEELGYKYNANAVMAALAISGLRYLDEDNQKRRMLAAKYEDMLSDVSSVKVVSQTNANESSRHLFQIFVSNRAKLAKAMSAAQIGLGVHYKTNCAYPMYKHFLSSTPNASKYSQGIVSLPLFIEMTAKQQEKVVRVIQESAN
jgi:dTDP-4-amino-4,6-dideoxygalactose transaminase